MSTEGTAVYRVERMRYGEGCEHWGQFSCKRLDVEQNFHATPHIEDIIDQQLADGTIIEVTVRIVKDVPWPPIETNSWHDKNKPAHCEDCHA